jgi:hypothetical protein
MALSTQEAFRVGRRGGRARARKLSASRRSEIASWARFIRRQKERGEVTEVETLKRLIHQLHASDPDLAAFVKLICRLPWKYQENARLLLPLDEQELVRRTMEQIER